MKTFLVLYRTVSPGNIETDRSYRGNARNEEMFRQSFAVLCAAIHPGCEIRIQGVAEVHPRSL